MLQFFAQAATGAQDLRDIRPPVTVPLNLLPAYIIGGLLLCGGIAAAIAVYRQKRQHPTPAALETERELPEPHEAAYAQLAAIEAAPWLTQGDIERYHTEIAAVLREYITARYGIPALRLTTAGLLRAMHRADIAVPPVARTHQLLVQCDRVKFAAHRPADTEATTRITEARWIVDTTRDRV